MALNVALKVAIIEAGWVQIELANKLGIHESTFSKIVNGHLEPSDEQKQAIARVLGRTVDQLFPEVAA